MDRLWNFETKQFRNIFYIQWKLINPESPECLHAKLYLKVYNGILIRNIKLAKKIFKI